MSNVSYPYAPEQLAARHHRLRELGDSTVHDDIQAVLNLGAGVVLHGTLEPVFLEPVLSLIDPDVRSSLESEHTELEADLELLADLDAREPGSEDVRLLAQAVLRRLRDHLRRDERTLYRPLARMLAARSREI